MLQNFVINKHNTKASSKLMSISKTISRYCDSLVRNKMGNIIKIPTIDFSVILTDGIAKIILSGF